MNERFAHVFFGYVKSQFQMYEKYELYIFVYFRTVEFFTEESIIFRTTE